MDTNRRIDFKALREQTSGRARDVLAFYGLAPVGSGDQVRITCPFHAGGQEKHPSCSVNLAEGLWHCHAGGCPGSDGGNLLELVHRMETKDGATVSIRAAGHKLAAICGIEAPAADGRGNGAQTRQEGRTGAPTKRAASPTPTGQKRAVAAPGRESGAVPKADRPQNKPLGFELTLDLDAGMPYLSARSVSGEVAAEFGL